MKNTILLSAAALVATVAGFGLLASRTSDAATATVAGTAMKPAHGHSIDLTDMKGVAYYTVEKDGYRVVATLSGTEGTLPVRFISTLAAGQKLTISVPRSAGTEPVSAEIVRAGDTLYVANTSLTQ